MGDVNRITHNYGDGTLEKIMSDLDHGKIKKGQSWSATHPAYWGTSIQQKTIQKNKCEKCAYFVKSEKEFKKICKFPWTEPKDYDKAVLKFLPCHGEKP